MRRDRRRWAAWAATAMMIAGCGLVVRPAYERLVGEWHQQALAARNDAAIPRYRNAVSAAYDLLVDAEDALVSYEIGARPTTIDGTEIALPAAVASPAGVSRNPVGEPPKPDTTDEVAGATAPVPATGPAPDPLHPSDTTEPPPDFPEAIIRIPKIGLSQAVVEGVSRDDLQNGPGHYPGTALPGRHGNVVISGHRTTYTRPFHDLDLLEPGDAIVIDTPDGSYRYLAEASYVVSPDDVGLLQATARPVLTLTTCTPKGSASQRLVVVAVLDGRPALPDS